MSLEQIQDRLQVLWHKSEAHGKHQRYDQQIETLEEILNIQKRIQGDESPEFLKTSEKLCEVLNIYAMLLLQREKFDQTLELLRKAEILSQLSNNQFKATTMNNLACYYRRTGKLRTALGFLQNALDKELQIENATTLADTHLNLCAVLSQLERHEEAMEHSLLSIIMLQDEFLQVTMRHYKHNQSNNQFGSISALPKIPEDRLAVLSIAYHNLGVEFEYLKRVIYTYQIVYRLGPHSQHEESIRIYEKAYNFAKENLGLNHQLVNNLQGVLGTAKSQVILSSLCEPYFLKLEDGWKNQLKPRKKNEIYKDLQKTSGVDKNLPKLKLKSNQQPTTRTVYTNNGNNHTRRNESDSSRNDNHQNIPNVVVATYNLNNEESLKQKYQNHTSRQKRNQSHGGVQSTDFQQKDALTFKQSYDQRYAGDQNRRILQNMDDNMNETPLNLTMQEDYKNQYRRKNLGISTDYYPPKNPTHPRVASVSSQATQENWGKKTSFNITPRQPSQQQNNPSFFNPDNLLQDAFLSPSNDNQNIYTDFSKQSNAPDHELTEDETQLN